MRMPGANWVRMVCWRTCCRLCQKPSWKLRTTRTPWPLLQSVGRQAQESLHHKERLFVNNESMMNRLSLADGLSGVGLIIQASAFRDEIETLCT